MKPEEKCVALIIGRGGSKRIPKKNIRLFATEGPMIGVPIRALRSSGIASEIFVDTDSKEIADEAETAGAQVPYLRDSKLADDQTTTLEVVKSAIRKLEIPATQAVVVVYPASYLTPEHYVEALKRFNLTDRSKMLVSVCSVGVSPNRLFGINDVTNDIEPADLSALEGRTQDTRPAYRDAGKLYMATSMHWLQTGNVFESAQAFVLPPAFGIDIDTPDDWIFAEATWRGLNLTNTR